jgi:hypothetical protein
MRGPRADSHKIGLPRLLSAFIGFSADRKPIKAEVRPRNAEARIGFHRPFAPFTTRNSQPVSPRTLRLFRHGPARDRSAALLARGCAAGGFARDRRCETAAGPPKRANMGMLEQT